MDKELLINKKTLNGLNIYKVLYKLPKYVQFDQNYYIRKTSLKPTLIFIKKK